MKIFPAVHYSMGGLWADYVKSGDGGMLAGAPQNHMTNLKACMRLASATITITVPTGSGANSLLSCIFTGLFTGSSILNYAKGQSKGHADVPSSLIDSAVAQQQKRHDSLLKGEPGYDENPYLIHQQLGDVMTRVATVVRRNDQLVEAIEKVNELHERAMRVSLSDTGQWTNQNAIFAKSVQDMFPLAKTILKGAFSVTNVAELITSRLSKNNR